MGRSLKPQKVKDVRDRTTGIEYPLMLDRNTLVFFSEPAEGVRVEAATAEECEKLLREKFGDLVAYDWQPVIIVDGPDIEEAHPGSFYRGSDHWLSATVEFKFFRCERSRHPDRTKERWVTRVFWDDLSEEFRNPTDDWDRKNLEKWKAGQDTKNFWPSPTDIILPYTPELWERMLRMKAVIEKAATDLERLLRVGQEDTTAFLQSFGSTRLLGEGERAIPTRSERRASRG